MYLIYKTLLIYDDRMAAAGLLVRTRLSHIVRLKTGGKRAQ